MYTKQQCTELPVVKIGVLYSFLRPSNHNIICLYQITFARKLNTIETYKDRGVLHVGRDATTTITIIVVPLICFLYTVVGEFLIFFPNNV